MIKKLLLAVLVTATFIIYSVRQRGEDSAVVGAPKPTASVTPAVSGEAGGSPALSPAVAYKDGDYPGGLGDAYYGYIQLKVTIKSGKITDVTVLQSPNDSDNSVRINSEALPILKQEAIQAQSAQIDIVSGATDTSQAFVQSLSSALTKAKP